MGARTTTRSKRPRASLPAPSTSFVGRDAEAADLRAALSTSRLVTIVGGAGVGKTRLALEVARVEASRFEGGLVRVDFGAAKDAASACAVLEAELGLAAPARSGAVARARTLGKAIAALGPALLVLDTFEHLAPAAAETIGVWLDAARDARFLVTSRRPLRLAAERVLELGALATRRAVAGDAPSPAAELFLDRARAQGAALGDDPESRALVGELVERVDGLPLAIELAANRVRGSSLRTVVDELGRGIDVLAGGLRDAPARHESLGAALEASWSLATPPERVVAAELAVFTGSFTAEDARAVVELPPKAGGPALLDVLGALTDASMLRAERAKGSGAARFRMSRAVRWFALARLAESGDREDAVRRHAEHHLALAAASPGLAPRPFAREARDDLAAALRWACVQPPDAARSDAILAAALACDAALAPSGALDRRIDLLGEAIASANAARVDSARLALARARRARALSDAGRGGEARAELRAAEEMGQRHALPVVRAELAAAAADEALGEGRLDTARTLLDDLVATQKALGDRRGEARAHLALSRVAFAESSFAAAQVAAEQGLAIARAAGDALLIDEAERRGAELAHEAGRVDVAAAAFGALRTKAAAEEDGRSEASAALGLARVRLEERSLDDARALIEGALAWHVRAGDRRGEAAARFLGGLADELEGRLADASARYEDAIAADVEAEDLGAEGAARLALARVEARRGEIERGHGSLDEGRRRVHASGLAPLLPVCELAEAFVDLAAARAWSKTSPDGLAGAIARVRKLLDGPSAARDVRGATLAADARLARAILADALNTEAPLPKTAPVSAAASDSDLVVSTSAHWFRPPRGAAVSLGTRRSLRLILAKLADARETSPGSTLSLDALLEAGWPGERVLHDAGASRVYAAIAQLRRDGLRDLLVRRDDGYCLDPRVTLARSASEAPTR